MKKMMTFAAIALLTSAIGCAPSEVASTSPEGDSAQPAATNQPDASSYVSATEPAGAIPVGDARKNVKDDEAVTLVGLIGGSSEPFVDGLAAFTIVDASVPYCAEEEGCPTPWDYCCQTAAVKENIATVKVVDQQGNPVASDARSLLNVKELSTVVVQGTAKRDDQGNLSVLAKKVFVRPAS